MGFEPSEFATSDRHLRSILDAMSLIADIPIGKK
jgi:hypothetical protein